MLGRFGKYGGQYIPETLMMAVYKNLQKHMNIIKTTLHS
jgi:tryptophan synthase beta subunit